MQKEIDHYGSPGLHSPASLVQTFGRCSDVGTKYYALCNWQHHTADTTCYHPQTHLWPSKPKSMIFRELSQISRTVCHRHCPAVEQQNLPQTLIWKIITTCCNYSMNVHFRWKMTAMLKHFIWHHKITKTEARWCNATKGTCIKGKSGLQNKYNSKTLAHGVE